MGRKVSKARGARIGNLVTELLKVHDDLGHTCGGGQNHDWGKWRDYDITAEPPTFVRVCDRCKRREITDVEPAYVKRL